MPPRFQATTLKEEGNALFIAKKYAAALAKYSAALELDTQGAVLHANRAACYLALREYARLSWGSDAWLMGLQLGQGGSRCE
jgi:tetratricopeptide (TPR) repeat protein